MHISKFAVCLTIIFGLSQSIGCQSDTSKGKTVNIVIETTKGNIELELFESDAPKTVANFTGLA
jgi:hypothetical protein